MKFRTGLSCGVALGALLAGVGGALTADFTVQDGQTVTDTQTLSDPGDVGVIEAGGSISTAGLVGVWMADVDQRVTNNGDIIITGFDAAGIYSLGGNAWIMNNGDIEGSGLSVYGIASLAADAYISNSGDITTSGQEGMGIFSSGINARIDNSGDIITSGPDASGIFSISSGADAQITNRGNIKTEGEAAEGIKSDGINARINNSGGITTSGTNAVAIYSVGAGAYIENSGVITTSGAGGIGIRSDGANAVINNSGIITGNRADGIRSVGANAQIINSGEIARSGSNASGIASFEVNAEITNSGNITTTGTSSEVIVSHESNARITNSGKIASSGFNSDGIASFGANAQIINSGVITTSNDLSVGINADGAAPTVTNSGRIISSLNSYAIYIGQQDATLNLLAGSVIQGGIFFGQPGSATLKIGPGLNTALTFDGLPVTIDRSGAPMAVQGTLVAVVDPTGFSAQDEMLTDLTRAIAGAVDGRLNAARFGYVPLNSSVTAYVEPEAPATTFGYGTSGPTTGANSGFWAAGIGAYRTQDADGPDVGFDTALGGLLVGYDAQVSLGTKVGAFLGASTSRFETDANSQEIDADSYYGGVYAGFTGESYFLDVSVTGGVSQQSSDRTVANNLVEGGIEHAAADYDGVFVSPSATIGTTYALASGNSLIPSFRARYAGLFLDSYDESGSAADLSVDSRNVNVFDFRAQLAYALAAKPLDNGTFNAAFRFGGDATFADNDNVDAALLGTALNFDVSGDDTLRGFAGVDLSYRTDGGSSFFLGAEAGYDSGDAFTLDVQGGLKVPL